MRAFSRSLWIASALACAVVIGCVTDAPDALAGKDAGSVTARPQNDPSGSGTGGNSPRGNGNTNGGDNGNDNGAANGNDNGATNGNGNDNSGGGTCDPSCPDFDGSGTVTLQDLAFLLSSFGLPPSQPCLDLDRSGLVDVQDLAYVLAKFGESCVPNGNGNGNGNDNGSANGNDNGATNGNDNGTTNGNDNGSTNGNDNGAANGNDNGAANGNDNSGTNGNDNAANGNDNAANGNDNSANGNDNGANGNDNGSANGNDNGANGNDNGANGNDNGGSGNCPDGSTQLATNLSDGGDAEYRDLVGGCRRFRVRTRNAPPSTTLPVFVNGVVVGSLTTDSRGRGELRYDTSDGNFPAGFPALESGDVVTVGSGISGVLGGDCSANSNCNG